MRRYLLETVDHENLRVFVVWGPMLGEETEEDAREASAIVPDPRALHFWSDSDGVADLFQKTLGFTDERKLGWDTFTVFGPGNAWSEGPPPEPDFYMHVDKPLPEERRLNAITLAAEVSKLLGAP